MSIQAQVLQKRMIMTCSPPSNNISQQQHLFHLIQAEPQINQSKQQLYQTNIQLTQTKTAKELSQQSPKLNTLFSKSLLIDNEPKKTKPIKPPNRNNSCVQLIRQEHVSPSHLLEKMKRIEKPTKPSKRNPYEEIKKQVDTSLLLQSARQNIQDSYQQSTVHTQPQNTSQNVQDLLFDYQSKKHEKVTNIQFKQQMLKQQQENSNKQQSTVSIFDQLIQQQLTYLKMDKYQDVEQQQKEQHLQEKQDNNVKTQKFNHNPEFDQLLHKETLSNGALGQQQTIIQHNQQYNQSVIEEQDDYIVKKPLIIQYQTTNNDHSKENQNLIDVTVNNFKDQEQVTKQQNFIPESNSHQLIDQDIEQTASIPAPPDVVVVKKVVPPVPSQEYPPQSNQTQPLNNELPKQVPMQQQRSLSQTQEVEVIEEVPKVEPVQAKQAPKLPASNAPPKGNMKAIFNFSEYVFDEDPDNKVDYQMMEPKKKKVEVLKVEKEPDVQAVSAQPSEVKEEPKLAPKIAPKISIPPQAKVQPKIPGKAPEQTEGKQEAEKPKEDQSAKASAPPKGNMKAIFNFSEYVFDEDPENKVDYEMMEPKKKKTEPTQVKEPEPAAQQAEVKPVEKQPTEKQKEEPAAKAALLKVQLPLPPNKIQPKIPGKAPVIPKATGVQQQQEAKPEGEPKAQPPSGNMKAIFNFSEYVFDEDPENKVDYEMLEPKKKKAEKEPEAPMTEKEQEIQAVSSQPSEVKEEAKPVKITPKINIPPQVKIQPKIQPKIQIPSKDQNETKISEDKQSNLNDNKSEPLKQTESKSAKNEQKSENSQLENKSEQKTEEEPSNSEIKNSENGSNQIKPLQKQITQPPMLRKIVPSSTVIKPPAKIVPPKVINQASINRPQLKIPVKPPVKAADKQENNESQ
ncbi:Hypothetical_protein [Hexamita inflata]|uniref:Hypothetical_protein n=1 Tax=Hexamita inflata TaxID=28002 RepID=A0AA86R401_9EUKA|nr:Hypothetical protein HINF_LOCUS54206 [Hexamita inflata]